MSPTKRPIWPILAGVFAGAVGAIVASLVSLPLRSPDDLLANTASVTIVALVLGIATGVIWRRLHGSPGGRRRLLLYAAGGFVGAIVVLAILEAAVLDRFISFGVPLAAIIFAALGILPPIFTNATMPRWTPLAAVVLAMLLGGFLASYGDDESGDLSLDDLPVVTATAAPATTAGPAATTSAPDTTTTAGGEMNIPGDLATTSFTFSGGTATWTVDETLASVGAATAVGRSDQLSGRVDLNGSSEISVDLTSFDTGQDRRDSRVRRLFAASPIATFNTTELTLPATYAEGAVLATEVTGELTINGVTRTVTWSIQARLIGTQLDVTGELDIVLTDFDVEPPSSAGFVTVADGARLEVLFSATG